MDLDKVKEKILSYAKKIFKYVLIKCLIPVLLVIIMISAIVYYITLDDATYKEGDMSNAPYAVSQYTDSLSIGVDGQLTSSMTAQELWDLMKKNGNRGLEYLDTPEDLLKLMNAELVTQYLDTRSNPDEEIDWDSINDINSKKIQGIVKLKRADSDNNNYTMTYVDAETFQKYIDNYNSSGSEKDRKIALSHFTLSTITDSGYDNQLAATIKEGDTIKIPNGFGSVHTYMGWQMITSVTSVQYKLREQAGMNFDSEGFGKINGRYVIACTTTYGNVGDYVDFYQKDGTIIPCIIGDIKNQNDAGCNKWGHENGHCIIEFVVNKDTWYNSGHPNPGTQNCHPEWNKNLTKAVNGGNYFNNPNFGVDTIKENNVETEDSEENDNVMKWPTDGTNITSQFGLRDAPTSGASTNHRGIDIGISEGTNVYACEAGKVTMASFSESAGNMVTIDHGNGYVSKYMHNSELKVSVGDKVEKGQLIALSGNTGISTGPHLHFQIEYQGSAVDPLSFKYDNEMGEGNNGVGSNESDQSVTKYYAKVATWNETTTTIESNDPNVSSSQTTTHSMNSTNISYQEFISGYTMPFEYLWALLVVGEDKDFALELADLVYGSDIEITVHDNLTINTDTEENTYTNKKKTITDASITISYDSGSGTINRYNELGNWTDEESESYKVTETVVNKTNTLDISLTKADVWVAKYLQEYKYEKQPNTLVATNEQKLDDDSYPDINSPDTTSQGIDTYGHAQSLLDLRKSQYKDVYTNVDGKIDYVQERVYYAVVDKKISTTNETETMSYVSSPGNTIEKTNKDANKDNFVTIFLKKKHKEAREKIIEISSWLFEILESNENTADMVDLTKYLLYKATGTDYGISEYDFSEFSNTNFTDYNVSYGDYIVKTDEADAAPVVKNKQKLKEGLKKWLKNASAQKENALSIIDVVLECQEEYDVNAVFVYAFLRNETGIGTADTDYVKKDNNWGSWDLGTKYDSAKDNIKTITKNMKNGNIYFTQGNISVSKIGAIYCPNEPEHPSQGDKWIESVQNYMNELYTCMGVELPSSSGSVAAGGQGTIGVYTSSTGKKYNLYLQGSGSPWANEDYGNDHSMAKAGCGPTAEAIIASAYNGDITPSTARKDIVQHLGLGNHSSANWIGQSLNRLIPGVKTSVGAFDENKIKNCLKNSGQVWLVVQTCKYTSGAHCIALIDYKDTGQVYVAHGTAKSRPYGWEQLSYIKSNNKYNQILYIGGK